MLASIASTVDTTILCKFAAEARLTAGEQEVTLPWCACSLCLSSVGLAFLDWMINAMLA